MSQNSESVSEQTVQCSPEKNRQDAEKPPKRPRIDERTQQPTINKDSIEKRLINVLSCVVCFDLPYGAIYQCQNGHLMCHRCYFHLLADGRLKNEQASCPTCRIELSTKSPSRNLAAEKAVSELSVYCQYCQDEMPRNTLLYHETQSCAQRPIKCKYENIGCRWVGKLQKADLHEKDCSTRSMTGDELLRDVDARYQCLSEETQNLKKLFAMLSYEKIAVCDIQLCPSRSDDYIPKLCYETNRFQAFDQSWMVKANVIGSKEDFERSLSFQLIFKGRGSFDLRYFLIKGPFNDSKIEPQIQRFDFREDSKESEYNVLSLGSGECNRLLAARTINVRLIMFLAGRK